MVYMAHIHTHTHTNTHTRTDTHIHAHTHTLSGHAINKLTRNLGDYVERCG